MSNIAGAPRKPGIVSSSLVLRVFIPDRPFTWFILRRKNVYLQVSTPCCGQTFSRTPLSAYLARKPECPLCRYIAPSHNEAVFVDKGDVYVFFSCRADLSLFDASTAAKNVILADLAARALQEVRDPFYPPSPPSSYEQRSPLTPGTTRRIQRRSRSRRGEGGGKRE